MSVDTTFNKVVASIRIDYRMKIKRLTTNGVTTLTSNRMCGMGVTKRFLEV